MNDIPPYRAIQEGNRSATQDHQGKITKSLQTVPENPQHPSLGVKKIKGRENIWEGRIDDFYRFTFEYQTDPHTDQPICLFRNIGRHDIIDHAP